MGGGGRRGELIILPSAKKFFIVAMLLWDEDDIGTGTVVFYSVIYNSVITVQFTVVIAEFTYFKKENVPS